MNSVIPKLRITTTSVAAVSACSWKIIRYSQSYIISHVLNLVCLRYRLSAHTLLERTKLLFNTSYKLSSSRVSISYIIQIEMQDVQI